MALFVLEKPKSFPKISEKACDHRKKLSAAKISYLRGVGSVRKQIAEELSCVISSVTKMLISQMLFKMLGKRRFYHQVK